MDARDAERAARHARAPGGAALASMSDASEKTLAYYEGRAAQFWEGTRDHDVRQNMEALLRHVRNAP